ncbi:MAG: 50S ribosomal protein L24 [Chloroflexi bacterium]|nr:MAG: 50S ribosomal protein L24 [Chloroflexota bacterium]
MNRVRKGDQVEILSGDEKGLRGIVRQVLPRRNRVIIEGMNIVKKHQRPTPTGGRTPVQAGIIEFEAPIHLSNVAPVCPSCDQWTRVSFERTPDGGKVRVCKRCGAHMD